MMARKFLDVVSNAWDYVPPLCMLAGFILLLIFGDHTVHTLMLVGAALGPLATFFSIYSMDPDRDLHIGDLWKGILALLCGAVMGAFLFGGLCFLLRHLGLA